MASKDTPGSPSGRGPVLVVGAASRDISAGDPRGWRLGGAVSYCSLTLARLGIPTRAIIGLDALAAGAAELHLLRDAGVDVVTAPLASGPVFEMTETAAGSVQRCLSTSAPLDPGLIPGDWSRPAFLVLAPVAGELPDTWSDVALTAGCVALGWQGLLRTLTPGERVARRPPAASPLIAVADLVVLSAEDVDSATPLAALRSPLAPGATLVLTDGERGGFVVGDAGGRLRLRRYPAIPSGAVADPTGAGDVFLAALVAGISSAPARDGIASGVLRVAAAAAALSVEGVGLWGVPTLDAVRARARSARALPGGPTGNRAP